MASKKNSEEDQKEKSSEGSYVLPRNLEIADIDKAYQDVVKFIGNSYEKFVLDAGEVALIDTAGVQFLLQLVRSLKATGCELSWTNDSIQVYQMAAELGVNDELE